MPVICQINIKDISGTIDIGKYVFSDVIMEDMPIRISISIRNTITVSTDTIGTIIYSIAKQNSPSFIKISASNMDILSKINASIYDVISVLINAKAQKYMLVSGEQSDISVSVYGNEHVVLCATADGNQIDVSTSDMFAGAHSILSTENIQIDVETNADVATSIIAKSIQNIVSVNEVASALIESDLTVIEQNIEMSTSQINALVGLFTTVEDCSIYTIEDLSNVTASGLYFITL